MKIQEVKTVNDGWDYLCQEFKLAGYWQERIHGGQHVVEVKNFTQAVIESSNWDVTLASWLMLAANLHDLGRLGAKHQYTGVSEAELKTAVDEARIDKNNPNYVDHAHLSANLFRLMTIREMLPEEKNAVEWAIRNHSNGLVGLGIKKAETLAEQILGFLVFADHCGDAASPSGVARAAKAIEKKPRLSKMFSAEHLREIVENKEAFIPVSDAGSYKNESLVAHLVYNYQASRPIIDVIAHLLSDEYLNEVYRPIEDRYRFVIEAFLDAMNEAKAA